MEGGGLISDDSICFSLTQIILFLGKAVISAYAH